MSDSATWLVAREASPANRSTQWLLIRVAPEAINGEVVARFVDEADALATAETLAHAGEDIWSAAQLRASEPF